MDAQTLTDDELRQAATFHGIAQAGPASAASSLSDDELRQAMEANGIKPEVDLKESAPWYEQAGNYVGGAARTLQNGIFGGFADELHGAVTAIPRAAYNAYQGQDFDVSQGYAEGRDDWRDKSKAFREQNPVTSAALEIGGAVTSTAALPFVKALSTPAQGANLVQRAMTGAKAGAGLGAVYGAGNAEGDLGDRAEGALKGATYGGITGGVAVPVFEGAGKALRLISDQTIGRTAPRAQQAAYRKIAEALQADGLTPQQAGARIQQLGPEAALMDAGPNAQALARAIYTQPGPGKTKIGDFLRTRQEGTRAADATLRGGQNNRVSQSIDDLIPGNARDVRQGVQSARQTFGQSYEAAKGGQGVNVRPVLDSLDNEIGKSKGGIKDALRRVRSFMVDDAGNPETTIDTLHQAKMAIDDLMSGEARSSMGTVAKARIRAYQDQLIDAIESAGEAGRMYRDGRMGTAAAWRVNDALDMGEQFMLKRAFSSADEMKDALARMRPEETEAFRTGAAQAIKSKLGDMNTRTDVTKRLKDIPALEQKIKAAFGDNATFKKYINTLTAEADMFGTYGKIMGGSRTGEVIAEQSALNPSRMAEAARQVFMPQSVVDPVRGVANMAGALSDRATLPGPIRQTMADALTGRTMPTPTPVDPGRYTRMLLPAGAVAGSHAR